MSPLAVAPALPLHAAGKYVAGAYIVFVAVILIYVMIMAVRLGRTERALLELNRDLARREEASADAPASKPATARDSIPDGVPEPEAAGLSGAGRSPGDSSL
jgi:hypothetical protein